jgi:YgiT-type zinc finger domain-containing protein
MIPEKCSLCKGVLHEGKTEFLARVHDKVIVIRDVPAFICDRCGEAYFTAETSHKIDGIMEEAHRDTLCLHPLAAGEITLTE